MSNEVKQTGSTSLEIVRQLPGPIERVWDHLVIGELRQKWFCGGSVEPFAGGEIVMEFDNSRLSKQQRPPGDEAGGALVNKGRVLRYEAPHVLAFNWDDNEGQEHSRVTITLAEKSGGVELHLLHERLTDRAARISVAAGWHAHLDLLVDLLNEKPVRDFWEHHDALEQHYEGVLR